MENLIPFTIFGSGIVFGILMLVLIIIMFVADLKEIGTMATVAVLIFLGINYFWGNFPVMTYLTWRNVLIYLFLGFIFSLVRTILKGRELTPEEKKHYDLRWAVFRWWFLFPISAINWILGRFLKDVFDWIYDKIEHIYTYLFNLGDNGKVSTR